MMILAAVIGLGACGGGGSKQTAASTVAATTTPTTQGLSDAATTWCAVIPHLQAIDQAANALGVTPQQTVDFLTITRTRTQTDFWKAWGTADGAASNFPHYPVPTTLDAQNQTIQYGPTHWWAEDDWIRICNAAFAAR